MVTAQKYRRLGKRPSEVAVPHKPRLSWILQSPGRGHYQRAYQLVVARDSGPLWDSGRVESGRSKHVVYAGEPLVSHTLRCWKVRVWDQDDAVSEWSDEAHWSMGLLHSGDWQAVWIALPDAGLPNRKNRRHGYLPPCPFFRGNSACTGQ